MIRVSSTNFISQVKWHFPLLMLELEQPTIFASMRSGFSIFVTACFYWFTDGVKTFPLDNVYLVFAWNTKAFKCLFQQWTRELQSAKHPFHRWSWKPDCSSTLEHITWLEIERRKPTEFRPFLLYVGPVCSSDLLSVDQNAHFFTFISFCMYVFSFQVALSLR